ncbi:MAG: methyltransferase domain-containing protein [Xenococcus sp. (in: cyanobacteria)]
MKKAKIFLKNIKYDLETKWKLHKNKTLKKRMLEIGPGQNRISGFETIDIVPRHQVDYVWDVSKKLPFEDNTFEVIYSSHVLEHIPWFQTEEVIAEWVRILAPGGRLEIWVPDGLKICQVIIDHSLGIENENHKDGWLMRNPKGDPFLWANGRLLYGARDDYPSWHKAIFTHESLKRILKSSGLTSVCELSHEENRANFHHGWINLGVVGVKP